MALELLKKMDMLSKTNASLTLSEEEKEILTKKINKLNSILEDISQKIFYSEQVTPNQIKRINEIVSILEDDLVDLNQIIK
ncbi:MAG: hypothetical protein KKB31_06255 [Nanoarchaeota archaeon]|nr:hypothetical protein [Nanoarchaeota archaeon]